MDGKNRRRNSCDVHSVGCGVICRELETLPAGGQCDTAKASRVSVGRRGISWRLRQQAEWLLVLLVLGDGPSWPTRIEPCCARKFRVLADAAAAFLARRASSPVVPRDAAPCASCRRTGERSRLADVDERRSHRLAPRRQTGGTARSGTGPSDACPRGTLRILARAAPKSSAPAARDFYDKYSI